MTIAVVILAVLAVAQQFFNAAILRAVVVDREQMEKLADNVSELAGSVLDLAKRCLKKGESISLTCPENAKGEIIPLKSGVSRKPLKFGKVVPVAKEKAPAKGKGKAAKK